MDGLTESSLYFRLYCVPNKKNNRFKKKSLQLTLRETLRLTVGGTPLDAMQRNAPMSCLRTLLSLKCSPLHKDTLRLPPDLLSTKNDCPSSFFHLTVGLG